MSFPPEAIRLLNGFLGYQSLVAACELKLPDLLADGPRTAADLASATGTHAPSLRRLLRGLAAWRFLREETDGSFAATPVSDVFRSDQPGLRSMALMLNLEGYKDWAEMLSAIQTGAPVFERLHGESRWAALAHDPEQAEAFNAAMVETSRRVGRELVAHYDFAGVRTAVDVAGGNGALLAAVVKANPGIAGILFDLPAGLAGATALMRAAGVEARVRQVEGSFFESVPAGGDLYILKSIIHDWDDERAVTILRTCAAAMGSEARLILVERVLPELGDDPDAALGTLMADLHMMVMLGGRERTTSEYAALFVAAGLNLTRTIDLQSDFYAIEARKD